MLFIFRMHKEYAVAEHFVEDIKERHTQKLPY